MKSGVSLFVALLACLFCCCGQQRSTEEAEVSARVRIVSLAPSITAELVVLGLNDNIVGATTFCKVFGAAGNIIVGSATDVNIEKVLMLAPDIVFATTLTTPATIKSLRNLGLKVHVGEKASSFARICQQLKEIGHLVGKAAEADSVVARALTRVNRMRRAVPSHLPAPKVFFQIGSKPLFAVIPNTYMDDLITFAGCENAARQMVKGVVSRESVVLQDPDVIFITTMGTTGTEEIGSWKLFRQIKAVRNQKVYLIDSELACTPTVDNFCLTLEQVIHDVYE